MVLDVADVEQLRLSPPQSEFYWDDRRFLYFKSGRGCGKSTAACTRMIGMIERGEILPGANINVFGPDYKQLEGTMGTFDKYFDAAGLIILKVNGNTPRRELRNGSTVRFRSGGNPDQTRSHECQVVWLDEAAQMDPAILTLTNANLRQFGNNAFYQTILTSTPRGKNWLWRTFVNPETRLFGEDKIGYYHTTTLEAYRDGVVREGYIEELGYVPGSLMWKQEVLGEEVSWSGLVFANYDEKRHCPDPFVLPDMKRVVGGIDVGTASPTCLLLVGEDREGRFWTFKEWYQVAATPHQWMQVVAEWQQQYNVRKWAVDAQAKAYIATLQAARMPAVKSIKANDATGQAVNYINSRLDRGMMFASPECRNLIREIEGYEYKEVMRGDEVTFLDKVKANQPDHAIDAWKYAVIELARQHRDDGGQRVAFSFGGSHAEA